MNYSKLEKHDLFSRLCSKYFIHEVLITLFISILTYNLTRMMKCFLLLLKHGIFPLINEIR